MKTPRRVLAVLVVCAALSACGGQGGGPASPSPTGAAPVPSSTSPDPSASATPSAPADPLPTLPPRGGPSKPPGPGGTTLTGTVQGGVEPNCLLLDGNLLIGGPRDLLRPGAKVTVTGRPQPDMMTTCQQGTPFVVESARPA
ncbi:hypothetical protein MRQ36_17450 [Micromonospora sp. R77]|uniref:hypothetical protein n=1 Tax=Micromonospora sp. R77 TaxID=2925836 RepID=UPI001F620E43|nr:hypothetical protein [Micromonospora sp. R77]MCI4064284.1 hypothetical protein [Micromonospora sp. R77]